MKQKVKMLLDALARLGLQPVLGVEIEFYLLNCSSEDVILNLLAKISSELGVEVKKEKGYGQYEVASQQYKDVWALIDFVNAAREKILAVVGNEGAGVTFQPKPYINDHGSAMHIHLSLVDYEGENIFNRFKSIEENTILLNVMGGILELLNSSLYMIVGDDESELDRLYKSEMAPTTLSWGKNNRTTALRIPDSLPCHRNRRIEFRVPSSQSNIEANVAFLLTAAAYGVKNNISPGACIYGNANDAAYGLKQLYNNLADIKKAFVFWNVFDNIVSS